MGCGHLLKINFGLYSIFVNEKSSWLDIVGHFIKSKDFVVFVAAVFRVLFEFI